MPDIYQCWVRDLSRALMTVEEIAAFTGFTIEEIKQVLK